MDCRHIIVVIHEAGHFELKNVLRHRPIYRCDINSLFEFPTESIISSGPVSIKTVIRAFGNPLIENVNSASELPMIVIDGVSGDVPVIASWCCAIPTASMPRSKAKRRSEVWLCPYDSKLVSSSTR